MHGICIQHIYCMETSVSPLFFPSTHFSPGHQSTTQSPDLKVWKASVEKPNRRPKKKKFLCHMKDLSFRMRDWAHAPLKWKHRVYHWTTRAVPRLFNSSRFSTMQGLISMVNHRAVSSSWFLAWSCSQIPLVAGREEPRPQFCGSLFDCNPMATCGFSCRCGEGALNWSVSLSPAFHPLPWMTPVSWESGLILRLDKNLTFRLYFIRKCFRFPHLGDLS